MSINTIHGRNGNEATNAGDNDNTTVYESDPVSGILDSALPYEERLEQLVDLFYAEGDMDFEDYLPHEVIADFQRTLASRNRARQEAEGRAGR